MYSMAKSHLTDCRATLVAENDRKHDYIAVTIGSRVTSAVVYVLTFENDGAVCFYYDIGCESSGPAARRILVVQLLALRP